MNKYLRYVVIGHNRKTNRMVEHGYSTELGRNAIDFAIQCADHPSMKGRVFGESEKGERTPIYTAKQHVESNS